MKKKTQKYNYGECEDFWIRGKLVVIDNVPAGVCPQCGSKVVNSETGKRLAALFY